MQDHGTAPLCANLFQAFRYKPYDKPISYGSHMDKHVASGLFAMNEVLGNGTKRLGYDRPLPCDIKSNESPLYSTGAKQLINISSSNGLSFARMITGDVSLDESSFSEKLHQFNVVEDWSNGHMIRKGIVTGEILLRREKIDIDKHHHLLQPEQTIPIENLGEEIGDFVSNGRWLDTGFYGQYVPLSLVTMLDNTTKASFNERYPNTNMHALNGLREYIAHRKGHMYDPVKHFLTIFDVAGLYLSDTIRSSPSCVCEKVRFVTRGSIYSAQKSLAFHDQNTKVGGDFTILGESFCDLDEKDGDVKTGDEFYIYLCVTMPAPNDLHVRVVKSKRSDRYVAHRLLLMQMDSRGKKKELLSDGVRSVLPGTRDPLDYKSYFTTVPLYAACKRIGFSTVGALNDDDWTVFSDIVHIKRFYLDIGNEWFKI